MQCQKKRKKTQKDVAMPANLTPCLVSPCCSALQAAWLGAVSPEEDKDDDVDPLSRSLQGFKMLSYLALLDKPVDTESIAYSPFCERPAGHWQVH